MSHRRNQLDGSATAEYALILALVVLAALSAWALAAESLQDALSPLYEQLGGDRGPAPPFPTPKEAQPQPETGGAGLARRGTPIGLPAPIIVGAMVASVIGIVWYILSRWSNGGRRH